MVSDGCSTLAELTDWMCDVAISVIFFFFLFFFFSSRYPDAQLASCARIMTG